MEQGQDPDSVFPDDRQSFWTSVTPLSKYSAMVLFIALPFVSGWIGYTFAPVTIVEVERVVEVESEPSVERKSTEAAKTRLTEYHEGDYEVEESCNFPCSFRLKTSDGRVIVEDLQAAYYSHTGQSNMSLIELRYISSPAKTLYFKAGVSGSDSCCHTVSYDIETGEFTDVRYGAGYFGTVITETGFMAVADVDGGGITVYDLEMNETETDRIEILDGTVMDSPCGLISSSYNLMVSGSKVIYGVHDPNAPDAPKCAHPLIEYRVLSLYRS